MCVQTLGGPLSHLETMEVGGQIGAQKEIIYSVGNQPKQSKKQNFLPRRSVSWQCLISNI